MICTNHRTHLAWVGDLYWGRAFLAASMKSLTDERPDSLRARSLRGHVLALSVLPFPLAWLGL